ncbi:MAG: DHCW motif cupin fold protein [Ignavibacteria bacterium]
MDIKNVPFNAINWETISSEEHQGKEGKSTWRVVRQGNIRARIVEYSPGYLADHWCEKGHVVYVLDGEFTSELKDGRKFILTKGMSYIVADNIDPHRSTTKKGVKLFIVD